MEILLNYFRIIYKLFLLLVLQRDVESFCKVCGRTVHDYSVDDEVWGKIRKHIKYGNTLCYDCFCEECGKEAMPMVWDLIEHN